MRWLKKEYRDVIAAVTYIGTRGGIKEFEVVFYDESTKVMPEHELEKYYEEERR